MRLIGAVLLAAVSCLAFSACAAQTDPASNVGALTATLNAHGHTGGSSANLAYYYFQYATRAADLDTQPAHRTPTRGPIPANVPGNGGDVAFGESVGGLTPGTTYYYRVCGRDEQINPAVCGQTQQFTTASSPQFTAHHFLEPVSGWPLTPALDDITSIGSRLYVSGGACAPPSHDPFDPCAIVGSLGLNGAKKEVDFPQDAPTAITRGPDGDPWVLTSPNGVSRGGALTHFGPNLETLPGSVDFQMKFLQDDVTAADGALWVVSDLGGTTVDAWRTDGTPIVGKGYGLTGIDPGTSGGGEITTGPDGALWVTTDSTIWRLTTDGQNATEFPLAVGASLPAITAGPDGALWFTAPGKIGRLTTGGDVRYFVVPHQPNATPGDITAGPDGALWFTEGTANMLGRITTGGQITEYPVSVLPNGRPTAITSGPDGALWFTDDRGDGAYIVRAG